MGIKESLLVPALAEIGLDHEFTGAGSALVHDGDLTFGVTARVTRGFMMRLEVAEFDVALRVFGGPGTITLRSSSRRGVPHVGSRVRPGNDAPMVAIADRFRADAALPGLLSGLDAKQVRIEVGEHASTARIRNVGLSRVVMAIPPSRRYITAGADQVQLLRSTLKRLSEIT